MIRLMLEPREIAVIQSLVDEVATRYAFSDSPDLLDAVTVYAQELPRRLRNCINDFRIKEPDCAICVISGYPIGHSKVGRTPEHWKLREGRSPAFEEEVYLMLCGSLLGDCIAWATQQDGHVVHDIFPIKGLEHEQLGTGSEELLWWHTEDAFHPLRGDYLGMMCLRNPDRVPTTFAPLTGIRLAPEQWQLLFEPHFTIRPDESHLLKNRGNPGDSEVAESYQQIEVMNTRSDKIAVLYGDSDAPYVRIDPYFMDPADDPAAQEALDALIKAIEARLADVVLESGDLCFIDNFQGVHGRKPFKARYDGNDRWLKRINITRDLRKSRAARRAANSRIIL